MRWFRNLGVSTKLLIGFGLVAAIIVTIGWLGVYSLGVLNGGVKDLFENEMQPSLQVSDLQTLLYQIRSNTWQILATADAKKIGPVIDEGMRLHKRIHKEEDSLLPKIHSNELRESFQQARDAAEAYVQAREEKILKPAAAGQFEEAQKQAAMTGVLLQTAMDALDKTVEVSRTSARRKYEDAQSVYQANRTVLIGIVLAGIV